MIHFENLQRIILGHSFAGSIVSSPADRMSECLAHLVYLDAQILESGESAAMRNPDRMKQYLQAARGVGNTNSIPPSEPAYFGNTDLDMALWVASKLLNRQSNTSQ